MELWDVYDIHKIRTGKTVARGGNTLAEGEYHLTAHIALFSTEGKMLVQQRAACKDNWPSMWDITVGGAVVAGEDSATGAERELFEEIGIRHSFLGVRPHLTLHHKNVFCDCYIIVEDVDPTTLTLQECEVAAVKWASIEEIFEMMNNGSFIAYHESFIRLLFDMRGGHTVHRVNYNTK